jgi:uncharacterized FlgJ-related protein
VRVKLYSCHTWHQEELVREFFLPSAKDKFEVVIKKMEDTTNSKQIFFGTSNFKTIVLKKVEFILDVIRQERGRVFVYSDVDVQFFSPAEKALTQSLANQDIVMQQDSDKKCFVPGFSPAGQTPVPSGYGKVFTN